MKIVYQHRKIIGLLLLVLNGLGCAKWVDSPEAKNQVESPAVFADSLSANAALLGIYYSLGTNTGNALTTAKNLSVYTDELFYTGTAVAQQQYNLAALTPDNAQNTAIWSSYYNVIYQANAVIENLTSTKSIKATAVTRMQAEAKFIRAYCYFNLFYTYRNIPLLLKTSVAENSLASANEANQILNQMVADLQESKNNLPSAYIGAGRVRANKYVAQALLARIYLFQGRWREAELEVNDLVNSNNYLPLPKPEDAFLSSSKEAIWQCWNANGFTADASTIIPSSSTTMPNYILSNTLLASFEPNDLRRVKWVVSNTVAGSPYYYPAKYKNRVANTASPEYLIPLRMGEMLLIRAEAYAQQNKIPEALQDLNLVRQRAGLSAINSNPNPQDCLTLIDKERQIELFAEMGCRYFELKRLGTLKAILMATKPSFNPNAGLNFPIPSTELLYNKNLKQNEGY